MFLLQKAFRAVPDLLLDPPAHFSAVFEEPLTEMVETLQQRGFACALELGDEDVLLSVSGQYVRRILDNITSNLVKYADPCSDILVRFVQEEDRARLETLDQLPDSCAASAKRLQQQRRVFEQHNVFSPSMIDGIIKKLESYDDTTLREDLKNDPEGMLELVNRYFHCG